MVVLPPVAAPCLASPDRELDPINTRPIDDRADAVVSRPKPRLGVGKGQEKGKEKPDKRRTVAGADASG